MTRAARYIGLLLLLILAFSGGVAWRTWAGAQKKDARKPLYYQDPMHPWYKSDKPGIAPDCGMKLEPVYEGAAPAQEARKVLYYHDPKSPSYRAQAPGINPETGNDLEPVYEAGPSNAVQVAADKYELAGLTFGTAELTSGAQMIRANGRIAVDETRVERVHSKTEGWIEKTFVNYTGELVKKGQPLLTMYSPELLATQREYLLAMQARESMRHSSMSKLQLAGDSLLQASRSRLALWDITPEQIAEIERTGMPVKSVTLLSPASGYVMEREAFPNQRIGPDMKLYTIADLSRVWVMVDVFEADAPSVRAGMSARVSVPATGKNFTAVVRQIQPVVEAATRTLKARLELPNPGLELRPDMWVEVSFNTGGGTRLTVPAEAIVDSGTAKVVYVDRGNGNLEPRKVETGMRLDNRIEITHGLTAAERIVTSGAFLLNSESQMRSAGSSPAASTPAAKPASKPEEKGGAPHAHD
ncbi:MAG: efflux RND transporter periplasmic adaptor subunit [Bryobacteraceae bacterium]|nr:efflux RND transporter periplasmic adaptor subunit [Bryobacteraceae bacterium]